VEKSQLLLTVTLLINEISRFHFIPLEMTNAGTYLLLDDMDLTSQERSESGVKNIPNFPSFRRTLHAALHQTYVILTNLARCSP